MQDFNGALRFWSTEQSDVLFPAVYRVAGGRKRSSTVLYSSLFDSVVECFRVWAGIHGVVLRIQRTHKMDHGSFSCCVGGIIPILTFQYWDLALSLDQDGYEFRQYAAVLCCKQEGSALGFKHNDPFKRRDRGSVRDHCNGVSVTISQPQCNGPIAITSFNWEHSHDIPSTIAIPRTPLPSAVLTDIDKYVNAHTDAGQIRAFITADYGHFSTFKLNNAIEKCRRDRRGDPNLDAADFATLLRTNPNVAFSRLCVGPMGQLTGGFWVLQDQVSVLQRFWRVLLQDVTHGTNIYRLKLSLICVVDHCFKTRVAAQAVIFGECGDWHSWVFESLRMVLAALTPSPLTLFPTQSASTSNSSSSRASSSISSASDSTSIAPASTNNGDNRNSSSFSTAPDLKSIARATTSGSPSTTLDASFGASPAVPTPDSSPANEKSARTDPINLDGTDQGLSFRNGGLLTCRTCTFASQTTFVSSRS